MLVTDGWIAIESFVIGEKAGPLMYIWFLGRKMDTMMLNMRNLFEQLVRRAEILSEGNELRKSFWADLSKRKNRFQIWDFYKAEVCSNLKVVFHLGYQKRNQWSFMWSKPNGRSI